MKQLINKQKYVSSLAFTRMITKMGVTDKWNKIGELPLYLGMIPLHNDIDKLINEVKITSVITILEPFELNSSLAGSPITHQEWKSNGVETCIISSPDFKPLPLDIIKTGVFKLEEQLDNGHTVYIHCKAGVGRSAGLVIALFMKKYNLSTIEAIDKIKEYRKILINNKQKNALVVYENFLKSYK